MNAKTGQGKGVLITNYLLRDEYYNNDFKGEDIYIFNPTMSETKNKILIKQKKIPNSNLFETLDDASLGAVLQFIQEQYLEAVASGEECTIIYRDFAECLILTQMDVTEFFSGEA